MKRPTLCENEDCSVMVFRSDLDDHMGKSCQYRSLVCTHCNEEYTYVNQEVQVALSLETVTKYFVIF